MIRDPETLNALLASVGRFVRERLVPAESIVAETDEIPPAIVDEMKRLGLFGLSIPEEHGGLGLTMEEEALVVMELTQTSPAFRSVIGSTVGIGSQGILIDGTREQQARWLPPMATDPPAQTDTAPPALATSELSHVMSRLPPVPRLPSRLGQVKPPSTLTLLTRQPKRRRREWP